MYFSNTQIVMQEVPNEISICFTITGCDVHCKGCHSPNLWKRGSGEKLTNELFTDILNKYYGFASCVLFMGGEWYQESLIEKLKLANLLGYNTCLYTGKNEVHKDIVSELTWLKTGPWIPELGGLDSKLTNQKFIEIKNNKLLNKLFQQC